MNCSCRTAALGIFVRSLTHVQVPSASAARRLPRPAALSDSLQRLDAFDRAPGAIPALSHRLFHTTCFKGSASEPAAAGAHQENGLPNGEELPTAPASQSAPELQKRTKESSASMSEAPAKPSRSKTGGSKKVARADKPKPDTPRERTKANLDEIRKPSLHERIVDEKEELEDFQERDYWKTQKAALKEKFPDGWQPRKKLSPDALAGIKALHQQFPEEYTTPILAEKFKVSPEAIRRILKSKWTPNPDEEVERQERWFERGKKVWGRWAEMGIKPPVKWRKEGVVRDPVWNLKKEERQAAIKEAKKEKRRRFRFLRKQEAEQAEGKPAEEQPAEAQYSDGQHSEAPSVKPQTESSKTEV